MMSMSQWMTSDRKVGRAFFLFLFSFSLMYPINGFISNDIEKIFPPLKILRVYLLALGTGKESFKNYPYLLFIVCPKEYQYLLNMAKEVYIFLLQENGQPQK